MIKKVLGAAYAIDVVPLEKRLEEAEQRLSDFNYEIQLEELCKKDSRNETLEDAAQIADGWDFGKPIAEEIRKMKGWDGIECPPLER
jgi:hypothetical protein